MDDNKFDGILKSKLQDYQHPVMDASALHALHHRNAAIAPASSWYSRHRLELFVASGLILFSLFYYYSLQIRNGPLMDENNLTTQDQSLEIEKLKKEIGLLKRSVPDTVKIVQIRDETHVVNSLLQRIAHLEESNRELLKYYITSMEGLHRADEDKTISSVSPPVHPETQQFIPDESTNESSEIMTNKMNSNPTSEKTLSAKSMRDIEKHYIRGVGIKIGPTAGAFGSHYSLGDGHINLSGGVLAEFIFSPSLGLETGLNYSERYYAIHDPQILASTTLPNVDPQLGDLQRAEVDYRMLEIPFNLKYRYPISLNNHWLAGIGYSSIIYLNETFEYTYNFDNQSPNPTAIISTTSIEGMKAYAGTVNISLGMSHALKNKKLIEGSVFYNYGIGTQGVEKTRAQYFGLRGIYWFTRR